MCNKSNLRKSILWFASAPLKAVKYFTNVSFIDVFQGSKYASDTKESIIYGWI